jgi:hypothetical protein
MKWVGHIAPMLETKNASGNLICILVNINIEVYLIKILCVGALDSSE